jgi:hypothetical protein
MGLLSFVVVAVLWWPDQSVNTPVPHGSTTAPATGQQPSQAAPESALKKESDNILEPTRSSLGASEKSELIDRIDADLSGIRWRPMHNYLDDNTYPKDFEKLKALAESGDGNAAYALATTLDICHKSGPPPMTADEFAEEIRMIREDHQVPRYENGERTVVDIAQTNMPSEAAVSIATHLYEECKNMPMQYRDDADSWMVFAADNGSQAAKSMLAWQRSLLGDPSGYLALWEEGYAPALSSISGFYDQQYRSKADPGGLVESFAYWLAFREMHYASRQAAGPGMQPFFGGIEEATHRRSNELMPWQIAEARDIAAEILRSRPYQCCTSMDVPK